jgi:cytochrome c oxidase assembly protein subunit 15
MLAGGFVAGLRAGLTYNTFPLMDGLLIPEGYAALSPFPLNWTENVAATQFNHRVLATLTLVIGLLTAHQAWRADLPLGLAIAVAGTILAQYSLGVATLVFAVPIGLGTLHQLGGALTLTAMLVLAHHTRWIIARDKTGA